MTAAPDDVDPDIAYDDRDHDEQCDPTPPPAPAPEPLLPAVHVMVHPIDLERHPTYEPGYRWCVMIGGRGAADLAHCVGAGHATDRTDANVTGESHGVAVCTALRKYGINATYAFTQMDWDPVPTVADHVPLATWMQEEGQ